MLVLKEKLVCPASDSTLPAGTLVERCSDNAIYPVGQLSNVGSGFELGSRCVEAKVTTPGGDVLTLAIPLEFLEET